MHGSKKTGTHFLKANMSFVLLLLLKFCLFLEIIVVLSERDKHSSPDDVLLVFSNNETG